MPTPREIKHSEHTPDSTAQPSPSWDGIELDLDLAAPEGPAASKPAASASNSGAGAAFGFDDLDALDEVGTIPLGIELGSSDLGTEDISLREAAWQPRAAASERNAGAVSSRVFLNAHSRPKLGIRSLLAAVAILAVVTIVAPYMQPPLIGVAEGWLKSLPYLVHGVYALFFFGLWAATTARAFERGPTSLYLVSIGSLTLLVVSGLNLVGSLSGSLDFLAFRRFMPYAVPLATAIMTGGFALAALGRAKVEHKENERTGWASLLVLFGCVGLIMAVRLARFDLPMWRIDMPHIPPRFW